MFAIGQREHGFQAAQHAIGAPVLGQFDGGTQQIALVFFQFGFEALEQGEGIRGAAGKPGQNAVVIQPPHLAGSRLDHDITQRHLAVAAERDQGAAADGQNGGAVVLLHGVLQRDGRAMLLELLFAQGQIRLGYARHQ